MSSHPLVQRLQQVLTDMIQTRKALENHLAGVNKRKADLDEKLANLKSKTRTAAPAEQTLLNHIRNGTQQLDQIQEDSSDVANMVTNGLNDLLEKSSQQKERIEAVGSDLQQKVADVTSGVEAEGQDASNVVNEQADAEAQDLVLEVVQDDVDAQDGADIHDISIQ